MDLKIAVVLVILSVLSIGQSDDTDITKGPPTYDKPWVPAWGWFGDGNKSGWKNKHEHLLNQTRDHKNNIKIVFYGDSKTEGWIQNPTEGLKVWQKYYSKRGGFNYGIGGDSTRQVLWRIEHKELDGLNPKVLVFAIGGNNFYNDFNKGTDEEIVKAEHLIFTKIHEKLPNTQIIFINQLPRGSNNKRAVHINSLWEKDSKSVPSYVHILEVNSNFTNSDGSQNTKLYIGDHIHLNNDGFEILAALLEPLVKKFLE